MSDLTIITLCLVGAVALELVAILIILRRLHGLKTAVGVLADAYLKKGKQT